MTLEEIAIELGVTRERVRQIEARAMREIRKPFRSNRLRPFIEKDSPEDYGVMAPGCRRIQHENLDQIEAWVPKFWPRLI